MSLEIVNKLKNCDEETRNNVIRQFVKDLSYKSRDMKSSDFIEWVNEFINNLSNQYLSSVFVTDKVNGLMILDALIDELDDSTIPAGVAKVLINCLQDKEDAVLEAAYSSLGKLYRIRSNIMAEILNSELRQALEVLDKTLNHASKFTPESRRLASVLVLAVIAEKAPSIFYIYVDIFIKNIWSALHDTGKESRLRLSAAKALKQCLYVIAERGSKEQQHNWCQYIYDEAARNLSAPTEVVHGSLLAIGELFRTGNFIKTYYKQTANVILSHTMNNLLRNIAIPLIPQLAFYDRNTFIELYLSDAMKNLLPLLKDRKDPTIPVFIAVGELL